jgi:hypothetical protein
MPKWITKVTASYENDEYCTNIIAKLTIDSESVPNYTLKSGILRFNKKIVVGNNSELRTKIITSLHDSALGGNSGEVATYQRVNLVFHWCGLKKDVITYVKHCAIYQKNKAEHTPTQVSYSHYPFLTWLGHTFL